MALAWALLILESSNPRILESLLPAHMEPSFPQGTTIISRDTYRRLVLGIRGHSSWVEQSRSQKEKRGGWKFTRKEAKEGRSRGSKSNISAKMTLPGISIKRVIALRTRKRTSDVVRQPPPSISCAHVDYNYPRVITTHTTVFQRPLTAVLATVFRKISISISPRGSEGEKTTG